jgi:hypothetical protein
MRILIDSNILCRLARRDDPQHEEARQALRIAIQRGTVLIICPQVEREFWAVATRPRAENGLGMTPDETVASLREWRGSFFLLPTCRMFMHCGKILPPNTAFVASKSMTLPSLPPRKQPVRIRCSHSTKSTSNGFGTKSRFVLRKRLFKNSSTGDKPRNKPPSTRMSAVETLFHFIIGNSCRTGKRL